MNTFIRNQKGNLLAYALLLGLTAIALLVKMG